MTVLTWDSLAQDDSDKRADAGVCRSRDEPALALWATMGLEGKGRLLVSLRSLPAHLFTPQAWFGSHNDAFRLTIPPLLFRDPEKGGMAQ